VDTTNNIVGIGTNTFVDTTEALEVKGDARINNAAGFGNLYFGNGNAGNNRSIMTSSSKFEFATDGAGGITFRTR